MAETSSDNIMELATVETLNQLSASQASLLLLRVLNTLGYVSAEDNSDLTFFYMLFTDETRKDIVGTIKSLFELDSIDGESGFTTSQLEEFNQLLESIKEGTE